AYDLYPNPGCEALGAKYVELTELLGASDIISLHCPVTPQTYHLIDSQALEQIKPGVMLINTSRGALIDTKAVIEALKSRKIGYLGLDVYEQESDLFFEDLSNEVIQDDLFQRLLTFPNVLITGHQAFFTDNALHNIAQVTLSNITDFEQGHHCPNQINID
ncbi:MAG: 2-hydroxyacid dehydrogenase, partial [Symploca sp. SIO3E6]|nr:2-hydroxyacid dehydrogenase [Caldora sp. SIO3E6]